MKKKFAMNPCGGRLGNAVMFLLAGLLLLANLSLAAAQKDKKKKKDQAQPSASSKAVMLGDEQQIDYLLSEMLGAWQIGDVEKLHATYADDVSLVSGGWTPPVIGWANYAPIFQQSRVQTTVVLMKRNDHWVIVHNHTSLSPGGTLTSPANTTTPQQTPAKPNGF